MPRVTPELTKLAEDMLETMYQSTGIGLAWNSPFGPLKLSLAQPINPKSGFDRIERLQLNFGTNF